TLLQSGKGVIGTTTASPAGSWNFDYRATTLAEGKYDFFANDLLGTITSDYSDDFGATVDKTPPVVKLSAPTSTASVKPLVRVQASDLNGLPNPGGLYPNGLLATLMVDKNRDGSFSSVAATVLYDGVATFRAPDALTPGFTYACPTSDNV